MKVTLLLLPSLSPSIHHILLFSFPPSFFLLPFLISLLPSLSSPSLPLSQLPSLHPFPSPPSSFPSSLCTIYVFYSLLYPPSFHLPSLLPSHLLFLHPSLSYFLSLPLVNLPPPSLPLYSSIPTLLLLLVQPSLPPVSLPPFTLSYTLSYPHFLPSFLPSLPPSTPFLPPFYFSLSLPPTLFLFSIGEAAGLLRIKLLREPEAAALAYGLTQRC